MGFSAGNGYKGSERIYEGSRDFDSEGNWVVEIKDFDPRDFQEKGLEGFVRKLEVYTYEEGMHFQYYFLLNERGEAGLIKKYKVPFLEVRYNNDVSDESKTPRFLREKLKSELGENYEDGISFQDKYSDFIELDVDISDFLGESKSI